MNINKIYEFENGQIDFVIHNLNGISNIEKYLKMLAKSKDYITAFEHFNSDNYEVAYRLIHGLKGVSLNLGLNELYLLCEDLSKNLKEKSKLTSKENFMELYHHMDILRALIEDTENEKRE